MQTKHITKNVEGASPSFRDPLDGLDQAVDVLSVVWLAMQAGDAWWSDKTPSRLSSSLRMVIDDFLKPVQCLINDYNAGGLIQYVQSPTPQCDPLVQLIENYRKGVAEYDAMPEEARSGCDDAALVAKTYGPPMDALGDWCKPASSFEGAIAALRFALDECSISSVEPRIENMIRAAYSHFANGGVSCG